MTLAKNLNQSGDNKTNANKEQWNTMHLRNKTTDKTSEKHDASKKTMCT